MMIDKCTKANQMIYTKQPKSSTVIENADDDDDLEDCVKKKGMFRSLFCESVGCQMVDRPWSVRLRRQPGSLSRNGPYLETFTH